MRQCSQKSLTHLFQWSLPSSKDGVLGPDDQMTKSLPLYNVVSSRAWYRHRRMMESQNDVFPIRVPSPPSICHSSFISNLSPIRFLYNRHLLAVRSIHCVCALLHRLFVFPISPAISFTPHHLPVISNAGVPDYRHHSRFSNPCLVSHIVSSYVRGASELT